MIRNAPMRLRTSRVFRFGLVGVAAFGVDAAVLAIAVHLLGASPYSARLVSFLAAATAAWALNRRFTFSGTVTDGLWSEWLRYLVSSGAGALFNLGVYMALVATTGFFYRYPVLAAAFGALAGMGVNFSTAKRYVFTGTGHGG